METEHGNKKAAIEASVFDVSDCLNRNTKSTGDNINRELSPEELGKDG